MDDYSTQENCQSTYRLIFMDLAEIYLVQGQKGININLKFKYLSI